MTVLQTGESSAGSSGDTDDGSLKIRPPRLEYGDGEAMWRLALASGVLEENSEYSYHMFAHFFGAGSVIAELNGRPVGFIAGFLPPDRLDTTFVWQIAVDHECRGMGIASAMLQGLVARHEGRVRYVEATVTPSNEPSQRTFRGFARTMDAPMNETVLFPGERFGGPLHEDEVLFRIGPIEQIPADPSHATVGART